MGEPRVNDAAGLDVIKTLLPNDVPDEHMGKQVWSKAAYGVFFVRNKHWGLGRLRMRD